MNFISECYTESTLRLRRNVQVHIILQAYVYFV